MSPQLDSTTGTTERNHVKCDIPTIQTCNCCSLLVDCSTWDHLKSIEDSGNEVAKGTTTSMSCRISFTCRLLHHLPTMSVLPHPGPSVSGGPDLRYPSPRRRRPRPAAPGPPAGGLPKPRGPAAPCLGPESSAADGDGTCHVT